MENPFKPLMSYFKKCHPLLPKSGCFFFLKLDESSLLQQLGQEWTPLLNVFFFSTLTKLCNQHHHLIPKALSPQKETSHPSVVKALIFQITRRSLIHEEVLCFLKVPLLLWRILNPDNHAFGTFSTIWNGNSSEIHSSMYRYTYIYFLKNC